jgi:hypothetical protein
MAKRFRIESGETSQEIKNILGSVSPYAEEALKAIESGDRAAFEALLTSGQLGERLGDMPDVRRSLLQQFDAAQSKLPTKKEAYKLYIDSISDEADATDQQLQDRIEAFQGLNSEQTRASQFEKLKNEISQQFRNEYGRDGPKAYGSNFNEAVEKASSVAASEMVNSRSFNIQLFSNIIAEGLSSGNKQHLDKVKGIAGGINATYLPRVQSGEYADIITPATNTEADVSRVNTLLADRANVAAANAKVLNFFDTAPGELEAERMRFFDAQRKRAQDYITGEYAPQVAERLAARGLGNSGQVGASIQSKYSNLLEGISQAELEQINQDTIFFADQSYNKVFSDLVNARTDVTNTISNERQNLRTNQANAFEKAQRNIENQFNFDLFKQQSQAAYNTYQNQVQTQRQKAKDQSDASLFGQVGQTVGSGIALAALL